MYKPLSPPSTKQRKRAVHLGAAGDHRPNVDVFINKDRETNCVYWRSMRVARAIYMRIIASDSSPYSFAQMPFFATPSYM